MGDALFNRLDNFPRFSAKDNIKLRELGDRHTEVLAAKNDGYLPGLAYFDTPSGINPTAEKLPANLQEKWLNVGTKYKEQHRTTFPPFSFFVYNQAKAPNDPNFILSTNNQRYSRSERTSFKPSGFKSAAAVHKTDVSVTADTDHMTALGNDSTRYCPVQKKCRSFRLKTLQQRKTILKEKKSCFKCCSPNHLAKDCDNTEMR